MKRGDVVTHSADEVCLPMTIQTIDGEQATCVFFNARGEARTREYPLSHLVPSRFTLTERVDWQPILRQICANGGDDE